jgi:hypothetical protein
MMGGMGCDREKICDDENVFPCPVPGCKQKIDELEALLEECEEVMAYIFKVSADDEIGRTNRNWMKEVLEKLRARKAAK